MDPGFMMEVDEERSPPLEYRVLRARWRGEISAVAIFEALFHEYRPIVASSARGARGQRFY